MSVSAPTVTWSGPIRRELRALLALAGPIIVGKLAMMGQASADVLLAGHISAHVLGAVSMGSGIWGMGSWASPAC